MKLVLIKLPATYADWYKSPAHNLSYISAYLESRGYECKIFDAYFNSWSQEELITEVVKYRPEIIGMSAMTHEINRAADIAYQLKEQLNVPMVIGGCHVTALPEKTLEEFSAFDYGVYGEGEKTILDILQHLEHKAPNLGDINGLVYRNGKQISVNAPRPALSSDELESLPYPAFHQYYGDNPNALADKDSSYPLFSSRGCPFKCAFCMQVLGRKVRRRSAHSVLQEIKYAISNYSAHTFTFNDEIFLFNDKHVRNFLQLLIDEGLSKKIRWSALIHVSFVKPDLVSLAKEAGCYRLEMGVESGDDEILKAIGKGVTVEQIRNAVKIIKDAKMSLSTFFILGHPNETKETLKKTCDLAVELNTHTIAIGIMVPYPGTKVYDMALQGEGGYKLLSTNWADFDKYGGKVLEVKGLPYKDLVKWQKRTLINFYLKNFRLVDGFKYFWKRKNAARFFIKRWVARRVTLND